MIFLVIFIAVWIQLSWIESCKRRPDYIDSLLSTTRLTLLIWLTCFGFDLI